MRKLELVNGVTFTVYNDRDCIFCDHCTTAMYSYNGPYIYFCDQYRPEAHAKLARAHTCELFVETDISSAKNTIHIMNT